MLFAAHAYSWSQNAERAIKEGDMTDKATTSRAAHSHVYDFA